MHNLQKLIKTHQKLLLALAVGLILVVGAYLRLYKISEYMTFLGDEGRDVLIVKRMIVDHKFTLLGPTASVGGFFMGPIYYYFMAPFLWLWQLDPTGPAVMVALFGIATIYLVFRVGKDFYDTWVGLIAASLYAVSPLVIAYSRSSWNPNPVPFFAALFILFLWRTVVLNRWKELFWAGIIFGIGLQLHYVFAFLFIVAAVWLLLFGRSVRHIRIYLFGILGFILGYAPFLAFEIRHGFPNTISILRFIFAGKETGFVQSGFFQTIQDVAFRLFGRLVFRLPQPERWTGFPLLQRNLWEIGIIGTLVLTFIIIAVVIFYKRLKKFRIHKWAAAFFDTINNFENRDAALKSSILLLIWFLVTLTLFGFYRKSIYDYYFGILFPLPFICTGLILWKIAQFRFGKILMAAAWAGLLFLNWQGRPFLFPPNNQLQQVKNISAFAFEKAGGQPFNFALITSGNSDHAYRYFFEIWDNPPVVIENVENDPQRKTVTNQLIIICEYYICQPLGHPLWEIAGFGQAEIAGKWDVSFVKVFRLVPITQIKK